MSNHGGSELVVDGLDATYGASQVLFGVKLEVERGETLALMGRNGAGKSTTFKAIAGLLPPRAGRVVIRGQDVAGQKPYRIARAGIAYVPEDRQVFPEHTVEENLEIAERLGVGGSEWNRARAFEMFPLLQPLWRRMAGRLSGGEQQMLTIARSLMGNPAVLLLDEPSEGLAPLIVQEIGALIRRLRDLGTTIILAEQNSRFCLAVATRVAVIDKGSIVWRGSVEQFRADPEVQARYLQV
ncbi:ABC transporter ATP-binding protein [Sediminicoccus rosea]|uniref:ABC transporter ATP-binding protein n=1 Tax=Sediminicoccus rosea TaxID=1225128 RepID=A0ABZ0PLU9_9PROT|nr:ABC transporter ATP-binding protein [Sediminicoccus rosea]WPB86715.1 ABC transporter ATP-binding protein [Sediminicoccus rosea]